MKRRIGIGGIHIESSTFSPYISSLPDFEVAQGEQLLARYDWLHAPWAQHVEWIPTLHARALPGGVVDQQTYQNLVATMTTAIDAAGPLDGFLLDCHGAMSVAGLQDAEADLAAAIRQALGESALLCTSLDLHANVSEDFFQHCDLMTAYRTAPHVDVAQTRQRAAHMLLHCLDNTITPYRTRVPVPILLPGEKTSTRVEPGKSLYNLIPSMISGYGLLDCAVVMGFPWADQPRSMAAVLAFGTEPTGVQAAATELAHYFWAHREGFDFVGPTMDFASCLDQALHSTDRPFLISDTGDNPGAGGSCDVSYTLNELLASQELAASDRHVLVAAIHDQQTVTQAIEIGIDGNADFSIGSIRDHSAPAALVKATVRALVDDPAGGPTALLQVSPHISVIVTSRRKQYCQASDYERVGVPLTDGDIVVVKIGYLEPDLHQAAQGWAMALTPGAVNQDLLSLPFSNLCRPLFPFDADELAPGMLSADASAALKLPAQAVQRTS